MCDRTSRFLNIHYCYLTAVRTFWDLDISCRDTFLLLNFTHVHPSIITRIFSAQHPFISICWPCFQMEDFFSFIFYCEFWVLTHLFLMLLNDAILFKLLKKFTFSVYFVHKILSHFEISNKASLHSVYINLVLLDILDWYYICTSF